MQVVRRVRSYPEPPCGNAASTARASGSRGLRDGCGRGVSAGERIFDGVPDPGLEPVETIHSPLATHVVYRVGAAGRA